MSVASRFSWVAVAGCVVVSGCADKKDTYVEKPVEDLYNNAMNYLLDENYEKAAKGFAEVERQHPYSVWATKSQLMAAYTLYEGNKYDESIGAAERFISLHPGHRDIAYAYYLKALDYYVQIADVARDQKTTQQAMTALNEVVRRFPESKYGRDARLKIDLVRDHLAGKEMEIGRYYERQGSYLAAVNRFKRVIDEYQTTTHVPEALHRLTECYMALGLSDEAKRVAAVLGYNYPGSQWYGDTYAMVKDAAPTALAEAPVESGGTSAAAATSAPPDGWFTRVMNSVTSIF
jgi:outer membrane protein assembly factor BamD